VIVGGFDIATTTGCAILNGSKPLHVEAFRALGGTDDGKVYTTFRHWFRDVLKRFEVERIAIEEALRTPRVNATKLKEGIVELSPAASMDVYLRLYGLRAIAIQAAHGLNVRVIEVNQATWRKSFTGNGHATKEESLALAQRIVPGLTSKDAAEAIGIAWHLNGVLREESLRVAQPTLF
jgi:Holliday junction resolvasome RuvABC endonuclease subunit